MKLAKSSLLLCLLLIWTQSAHAADAVLTWDLPASLTNILGYRVYWGTASRGTSELSSAYPNKTDVPGAVIRTFTVTGLTQGNTYFFSVKSYGAGTLESATFSNEVSKLIPVVIPPPSNLTIANVTAKARQTSADVAWITNMVASCRVRYGLNPNNLWQSQSAGGTHIQHHIWLFGLKRHRTHYYQVESTRDGVVTKSSVKSFRTS